MDKQTLIQLYLKEREYEKRVFGSYEDNPNLNVASFLQFIEETLEKAKSSYANKWENSLPPWLIGCREAKNNTAAPVLTYEYLIKIMALAGAALEAYAVVNVDEWRRLFEVNPKWQEEDIT